MSAAPRKLYLADLAKLRGVQVGTLRVYRSRGEARLPEPDGVDIEGGHARPWWSEATARRWVDDQPGKGWRRGLRAS